MSPFWAGVITGYILFPVSVALYLIVQGFRQAWRNSRQ